MTMAPDPLANNPTIRQWAEKFYGIKAWTMPDAPAPADDPVAQKRAELLTRLDLVSIGADLSPGARRSFAGGRKALAQALRNATEIPALNEIENQIATLQQDVAVQGLIATARAKATEALATAEAAFKDGQSNLEQGSFTHLETLLAEIRGDLAKAVSQKDFEGVEAKAKDFMPKATAAADLGVYFDRWVKASLLLLKGLPVPDLKTRSDVRTKAMADAAAKSKIGDFAGARVELDKWQTSGGVDEDKFGAAVAFEETMVEYRKQHAARCALVLGSVIEEAKSYRDSVKQAEQLAYNNGRFDDARKKIDKLVAYCSAREALTKYLRRIGQISNSIPALRVELGKMQKTQEKDPAKALQDLKSFLEDRDNRAIANENYSLMIAKTLQSRYTALLNVAREPLKTELQTVWADLAIKVQNDDFPAAEKLHRPLEKMFQFEKTVESEAAIEKVLKDHPTAAGYGLHTAYADALAGKKWLEALAAIPVAAEKLAALTSYLPRRQAAEEVLALLPADPPDLRTTLSDAIAAADLTARTDPATAHDDLNAVLGGTDYLGLALEIADYHGKLAQVSKDHARTVKYVPLPAAAKSLQDSLNAAKDLAEAERRYGDAYLALEQHARLLKEAIAMGSARLQVMAVIGGLKRAKTDVSAFQTRASDADKEAAKPDFAKAAALFESLLKDMDAACRAAAKGYETADKQGSNAGHSLDRHGPDVKPEDLIGRLTTGTPPNPDNPDDKSYTQMSTKFENPQDWLAGREIAAEAAKRLPPGKAVDINATSLPYDPAALVQPAEKADFVVDHGRPIDQGFVGRKKKMENDGGTIKEGKTYETFEAVEGLTRAYVNFIWIPKPFEAEIVDNKSYGEVIPADNAAYVVEHEKRHNEKPKVIDGRWVMMQQFPVAEGWDNVSKTYTNEPDNLIP